MIGRSGGAVEDVDGVFGGIVPKGDGGVAGDEVSSNLFHDAAYSSLGDAVEGVHVWGTGGAVDKLVVE